MSLAQLEAVGITPASVARMLQTSSRAWVGSVSGVDAAFSMANSAAATVFAMFVRPEYEGLGLGRTLMAETEKWLFSQGCGEIWLLTGGDAAIRAHGFYQRLGWRAAGTQPDVQIKYIKSQERSR